MGKRTGKGTPVSSPFHHRSDVSHFHSLFIGQNPAAWPFLTARESGRCCLGGNAGEKGNAFW